MKKLLAGLKITLAIVGLISISKSMLYNLSSAPAHECSYPYDTFVRADLKAFGGQLDLFERDNGTFPNSWHELIGDYLLEIPLDPWGKEYQYEIKSGKAIIYTYDQKRSTEEYLVRIDYNI